MLKAGAEPRDKRDILTFFVPLKEGQRMLLDLLLEVI
jgi:hypothetical protein